MYSDQWGVFNGMTYSTWEVNPPNPTGILAHMMVQCMNDPGPILDTRTTIVNLAGVTIANPTLGQMINDPLFNPAYSDFCYELPYMPGDTTYLDTPVVPTQPSWARGTTIPTAPIPMPRRRSAKWMAMESDPG